MANPIRPKTKAVAGASGGTVILIALLRLAGVDVDSIPPEALAAVTGAVATLAAYVKRDGLRGAWERLVNGEG